MDDDWSELVATEWADRLQHCSPLERDRIVTWCQRWHVCPAIYLAQYFAALAERRAHSFAPPGP
jgi:hypothetical protein